MTTPSRTLIDLAGSVSPVLLRDALDDALVRELTDQERLRRRLEETGRSGRAGAGILFELIEEFDGANLLPRSVLERRYLQASRQTRLPQPELQHPVFVEGQRYFIDFAYPAQMLALELDGWRFHGGRDAWEADIHRSNALVTAGWQVVRGTWRDLQRDPRDLVGRVAALLLPELPQQP